MNHADNLLGASLISRDAACRPYVNDVIRRGTVSTSATTTTSFIVVMCARTADPAFTNHQPGVMSTQQASCTSCHGSPSRPRITASTSGDVTNDVGVLRASCARPSSVVYRRPPGSSNSRSAALRCSWRRSCPEHCDDEDDFWSLSTRPDVHRSVHPRPDTADASRIRTLFVGDEALMSKSADEVALSPLGRPDDDASDTDLVDVRTRPVCRAIWRKRPERQPPDGRRRTYQRWPTVCSRTSRGHVTGNGDLSTALARTMAAASGAAAGGVELVAFCDSSVAPRNKCNADNERSGIRLSVIAVCRKDGSDRNAAGRTCNETDTGYTSQLIADSAAGGSNDDVDGIRRHSSSSAEADSLESSLTLSSEWISTRTTADTGHTSGPGWTSRNDDSGIETSIQSEPELTSNGDVSVVTLRSRDTPTPDQRHRLSATKLSHRSVEDLQILLASFNQQIQSVSEQLVCLLEERHDLRQQVDMRKIAVEQLASTSAADNLIIASSSCCLPRSVDT